jgi:hypothetical protein
MVGKTIFEQLKGLTPAPVFWSWGASNFQGFSANQIEGLAHDYEGGLMFYVRGHHHKGHVLITLAYDDTYTISTGHVRKGTIKPKKQVLGVHFDEMTGVIDALVERIDSYQF